MYLKVQNFGSAKKSRSCRISHPQTAVIAQYCSNNRCAALPKKSVATNSRNTQNTMSAEATTADPADLYQLEEQVGRGSFGVVHRARVKGTKDQVAIKIVDLEADVS